MNDQTSGHVADIDYTHDFLRESGRKRLKASLVESERLRTVRLDAEQLAEVRPMVVWLKAELQKAERLKTEQPEGIFRTFVALLAGPGRNCLRESFPLR